MSKFLLSILVITNFNYAFCAEGKGGMPQLNPESFVSQLFWLLIFFTILYLIINSVFIPKIKKIREDRDNTVQKLISESKSINDSIENISESIGNPSQIFPESMENNCLTPPITMGDTIK